MTVDEMIAKLLQFKEEDPECGDMQVNVMGYLFTKKGRGPRTFVFSDSLSLLEKLEPGENPRDAQRRRLAGAK